MKKILALVLALAMILMVGAAFAGTITINPVNPAETTNVKIDYTAYQIMEADIGEGDAVAYFVTTEDRAAQLTATNLFKVTQVSGANKWVVELKDDSTTAQDLVEAFSASTFDLSKFTSSTFDKAVGETTAVSSDLAAGYYYVTSSLGSKIALQTVKNVTIDEKNDYTTDDKTIPEEDLNSEIGKVINYTLTVNVPVTANREIILTDTMSKGLTFQNIVSQTPIEGSISEVEAAANDATKFTITYSEDQIKNLVAEKTETQTITVVVAVMVNAEAAIETAIPNTLDLKYGNVYDAEPVHVDTETYKVTFDKEDNSGTLLSGAEFKLTKNGDNNAESESDWLGLVAITAGQTYRLATKDDEAANIIDTIVTDGHTVTINGLDIDLTYYLVETKAPTGYNILTSHVELTKNTEGTQFVHQDVVNNQGTELPSTGGIGTTIFYILGGLLVVGAAVILVARRKAQD